MLLFMLIVIPIALGMIVYLTNSKYYKAITITFQGCLFLMASFVFVRIDLLNQKSMVQHLGGYSSRFAINLVADDISALLVLLTTLLFLMAVLYGIDTAYMSPHFLFLFLTLEGLIVGVFLVQDLFSLYALIEVSTIVVSILILYKKEHNAIYDSIVYLFTNVVAMTFYLIGIGYIYKIFGTFDLDQLASSVLLVEDNRTLILPYAFMMTAIGLKSAVMPLFSWLPHAHGSHGAPYIVSAILSALYIKGSLYIFIRIQGIFAPALGTHDLFLLLGFITTFAAIILALSQKDIKLILAYSTVSQIGLVIIGLSVQTAYSYYGAIFHIFNHALFKSALFLIAGIIIDSYGTRDVSKIRGLFRKMPLISIAMIVAMLGITGAPLFNGSTSKYLIQRGLASHGALEYGMILINVGTIAYMLKLANMLTGPSETKELPPSNKKYVIVVLSLSCFMAGIWGHNLTNVFFDLEIQWGLVDFIEKTLIYLFSFGLAYLLYRYAYKKHRFFHTIQEIELSFNELMFSIVAFFAVLLGYLMVTVV